MNINIKNNNGVVTVSYNDPATGRILVRTIDQDLYTDILNTGVYRAEMTREEGEFKSVYGSKSTGQRDIFYIDVNGDCVVAVTEIC